MNISQIPNNKSNHKFKNELPEIKIPNSKNLEFGTKLESGTLDLLFFLG
jgi:hypothetical protein